jgi:hypothetical protein
MTALLSDYRHTSFPALVISVIIRLYSDLLAIAKNTVHFSMPVISFTGFFATSFAFR